MRTSNASATWTGSLAEGNGEFSSDSGAFAGEYSFGTRFGEEHGTNPEELIAAAHASCFSMALALALGEEGYDPQEISTDAECTIGEVDGAPTITEVRLSTSGRVPDMDAETSPFQVNLAYQVPRKKQGDYIGKAELERQRAILTALGFCIEGATVHVPPWRPDVHGPADLVEEIARVASLTRLEGAPMPRPAPGVPKPVLTRMQRREAAARRRLAALGYHECVTYSFVSGEAAARFGGAEAARLDNPISSEMTHMRPDLLPGLLQAAARNQARGQGDLALFEVGPAFHGGEPGEQLLMATGLLVGATGPRDPHGARRPVDVFDAKADMDAVLAAMGAPAKTQILREAPDWHHPGRSGRVTLGPKTTLATFGELHPRVLEAFDLKGPAVAFTVLPESVPAPRRATATRAALYLPDLQAVDRDFAFVLDAGVPAQDVVAAAAGADKALIERVAVFDAFAGAKAAEQLGPGKKSLAITVRLQPTEKTLTEADIEAVSRRIVDKVGQATGGTLRG